MLDRLFDGRLIVAGIIKPAGRRLQRINRRLQGPIIDVYAVRTLAELKEMGIRVSIDDFGTGHSSLSRLKRFSLDALKIDRSFVAGVPGDREDSAIVRAITVLAHTLQLEVVAEGVETNFLREQGCDTVQGYLISYPIDADADAIVDWIAEWRTSELVHTG